MVGPIGHYAKWNKSDREGQIRYDPTYMWNLQNKTKPKLTEKIRFVVTRGGKWAEGGLEKCSQRYKLPFRSCRDVMYSIMTIANSTLHL